MPRASAAVGAGLTAGLLVVLQLLCACPAPARGLDNGAAPRPPMGWQSWNGFGMQFNASLFRRMASAIEANGLRKASLTTCC